ncbi:nicotinate-nicotinamide nucleotide adenylyltransferase [Clostridium aminobutyricum]|uniref:nicotinate-nucleotide adenylyltransferase n=1 Tax=Clostridium aminobutyricum TaxID=33953 RepID=A0A939D7F2_CLOAM|nr:hypothetical protein [Clostridium aminobutyricum]MBN7772899.1 hypothetical protein [Clostridium aminobutyricum]
MPKKVIKFIYKELEQALTDKAFLKELGISKKFMTELLSVNDWEANIAYLLDLDEITCVELLKVSTQTIQAIDTEPLEGWLEYIKNYTIEALFPGGKVIIRKKGMLLYLKILRVFIAFQQERRAFDPTLNIKFLTGEELRECKSKAEYKLFLEFWDSNYIYEFMFIFKELTSFDTLGHISGVHFTAMHVARQLKQLNVPIDLALVSGAAAGHDLGKFGCKPNEYARIPYLHYYYTDQLFKNNNMLTIGHIATNHSTWDLELENLSAESLILIYADFRVKSSRDENKKEIVNFYTLKESFDVILNKLDNVDEKKRERYVRVYSKLKDFEDYMESLGISTDLDSEQIRLVEKHPVSLFSVQEAIQRFKYLAIEHNIALMNKFNDETSFANLLEAARSEKQWKSIRAYLNIFSEYSTYMTQKQKLVTLNFLYELLMHREGDIRRQAGTLMANIIVKYDEEYRKELPENAKVIPQEITSMDLWSKFLGEIIFPDYKLTDQHRRWIGYSLMTILNTILSRCKDDTEKRKYLKNLFEYFEDTTVDDLTAFTLLGAILTIPLHLCSCSEIENLMKFASELSKREPLEIKIGALRFVKYVVTDTSCTKLLEEIRGHVLELMSHVNEDLVGVSYLKYKILMSLGSSEEECETYHSMLYQTKQMESDLYLENLKVGTPWVIKAVNIEFLLDKLRLKIYDEKLHIATHLSNLIKVSERVTVRHIAGNGLISMIQLLSLDQRNEIVIELTKGLEIGEYQFSKYVPEYLGELALYLHPRELDEFIKELKNLQNSTNSKVGSVTLDTIGVMIKKYSSYRGRFEESLEGYEKRREVMLGILLRGLANYDEIVSQEAFLVIGQSIFGCDELSLEDKKVIFEIIHKKMLTLIADQGENELAFFNSAAALNHLYRFISDYLIKMGTFDIEDNHKIAFFPGTFDPFSLSHKGIVREIKKLGFEVYLAIDEFSWSKKTQPRLIRKQIASMSIANERGVYIFPDDIPINIANNKDLKRLSEIFAGKELYMVVGSDVIVNASSYRNPLSEYSIHRMNHLVFMRTSDEQGQIESNDLSFRYKNIVGNIIELKLPMHLEDISSTRIRENIDSDRDISNLIDPIAQNYIYENSLYLREPQYKSVMQSKSINFYVIPRANVGLFNDLKDIIGNTPELLTKLKKYISERKVSSIIIRDGSKNNKAVAISLFHEIDTVNLYDEFKNIDLASYIRETTSGKIMVLGGLYVSDNTNLRDLYQIVLTETLAYCLSKDFTYAIYHAVLPQFNLEQSLETDDTLKRQGFIQISETAQGNPVYTVDMKRPIALFENMEMRIKSPFNTNEKILNVIHKAHRDMQKSLTELYKGTLVLSFNSGVMHHKLVEMITKSNGVPREATRDRKMGPFMCVPFGKILDGKAVPNTVTKTLHTEKIFDPMIRKFKIKEYPYYSPLDNQIRTIQSFDKPILLVDDLLHKGYRIKELDPILKENEIEVEKIIVGVLSGRGKDLMSIQNRHVDSAYFIPNLRTWFVDESMYPFIGGDGVEREYYSNANLLPSINLILPYTAPTFLSNEDRKAVFNFSLTCLKNARNILKALEEEFQQTFERNLTLSRLSEAIISPRYPDKGLCVSYDENLAPSVYISNDIEKLMRLRNMI